MTQKFIQIGNSVGIILPQEIRATSDIQVGDTVDIRQKGATILLANIKKGKKPTKTLTPKFAQMVDEFMTEHKDVLQELAKR